MKLRIENIVSNNSKIIEDINQYTYLGPLITSDYDDTKQIIKRPGIAKVR